MKYKLVLLMLFTLLMGSMGKPSTEAVELVEEYDGLPYSNYYADSVLTSSGVTPIEKTTAAEDTSSQFSMGGDTGDEMYLGSETRFDGLVLDVDENAIGGAYSIEYYSDTGWETLIAETSDDFKNDSSTGVFIETWDENPSGWKKTSLSMLNEDGGPDSTDPLYFVRIVVEEDYDDAPVFGQAGILNYNLNLTITDEIGEELSSLEETDFVFSAAEGSEEIHSYNQEGNVYRFALHSYGSTYEVAVKADSFVAENINTGIYKRKTYEDLEMSFAHKILAEDPRDSSDVEIDSAIAGSSDETCNIEDGIAYCAVKVTDDNDEEATVWADGYAPTTIDIGDRADRDNDQEVNTATMEYAYIATVKNADGESLSSATVTMGDDYGYTCTSLGSGAYGCVVPVDQEANIKIVNSGYSTATSTFSTTRNSNDDAQVTKTFTLNEGSDEEDDDQDLTVNDLYFDDEDLVIKVENEGDLDVSSSDTVYLYVYVDGDREVREIIDEDYLEAGEDLTIRTLEGFFDEEDKEWEIEVCIDATDDVAESDETNNCREETLGEEETSDEVDFEVTEVYLDNDGDLRFTFANTGGADASESSVEYTISVDGDVIETDDLSNNSENDFFDEGEETTYNAGDILEDYLDDEDNFEVEVCIDTDDDVNEESETNNCLEVDDDALDEEESCGNFTDTDSHWAEEYICSLYERDVVEGRRSTRFYPDFAVTRAEFLKMTLLGLDMEPYAVSGVYYDDVDSRDWHYEYVTYATSIGIVDGYEDGSFKPDQYITRAEAIVLLMRASEQEDYSYSSSDIEYWDVERSDWFAWAVVVTDEFNIVNGYSDDSFRPENHITRGESAKVIELSYEEFITYED